MLLHHWKRRVAALGGAAFLCASSGLGCVNYEPSPEGALNEASPMIDGTEASEASVTTTAQARLAWDGQTFVERIEPGVGARFRIPDVGHTVATRSHPSTLPLGKYRHRLGISGPEGETLRIHIWDNPTGLSLERWFDEHQAYLRQPEHRISRGRAGVHNADAIVVSQPGGPGFYPMKTVVFAAGNQIIRIECSNTDDPGAVRVFERVVNSFEAGGAQ